jgi:molybdopterin-binding protein
MKTRNLKQVVFAGILATLFASCDTGETLSSGDTEKGDLENGVLKGLLEEDYILDSRINYNLTGAFIVADGAKLTIPAGTQIVADAGGADVYVAVLKGGQIDIQGSVDNPVLMTSDAGESGDWGGLTLCGDATTTAGVDAEAEVGGFKYGGSTDADNSGSIKNLVIVGTGAQINTESQYNGISFYAVGSATVVENIAVINGADDGVEFFGGTVSVKNIYLENNEDDSIDWTEGWNGTVENAYIKHTIPGFSTAMEGDKDNNNPKFINLTAVSTVGGTALQFKKQSGGTITGLSLAGYAKNIDMKDGGELSNAQIDGQDADPEASYAAAPTVDPTSWAWIDTELTGDVILAGDITSDVTLDATKSYLLTSSYIVQPGAKLTIPAGTQIKAVAGGSDVYIAVLKGAQIDIQGTASEPVVMSSASAEAGDWGGLTICGKATTTAGIDAEAEVGGFIYGGTEDADNSGSIEYLVMKGTGAQINTESQYNGISLYAVGSGTVIENVAVINGADDGVEFFGGTVSVKNVYLENNEDDSIDWTEGWNGTVENAYIKHTIAGFSTVLEGDKDNNNPKFINLTAVSTVGGTALQFKKQSGGTITSLSLAGYTKNIDMKDGGDLSNVQIDGQAASISAAYDATASVDISEWTWKNAEL